MTNKRVRTRKPGTNIWISGVITQHINNNSNTIIELGNGDIKEINLSESVEHNLCWINGMCKHRHPKHQVSLYDRRVTVQRADDHTVANYTNLTLRKVKARTNYFVEFG